MNLVRRIMFKKKINIRKEEEYLKKLTKTI